MSARSVYIVLAILALVPSSAPCSQLIDIGLVNCTGHQLQLLIDYSSGRRIDWALAPHKSILMTRGFGEHIVRVTAAGTQQTYDVAALRQTSLGHRRDIWLCFSEKGVRVITSEAKHALDRGTPKA